MKVGRRTFYENVLNIPEATVGSFAIKHVIKPARTPVPTSNYRTAVFRGQTQRTLVFDHPTRWHKLTEDGGTWMTDFPIEQIQHDEELEGMRGRVLVGGLGLGYAVTSLARRKGVSEVVVVELQREVIDLVEPHLLTDDPTARQKIRVVQGDLFEYLKAGADGRRFTFAFYDIWASDGETTFHHTVMPLRRLSKGITRKVVCWNESVMRGQLLQSLESRLLYAFHRDFGEQVGWDLSRTPTLEELAAGAADDTDEYSKPYIDWARPFWRWVLTNKVSMEDASAAAKKYAAYYGMISDEWMDLMVLTQRPTLVTKRWAEV